MTYPYPPISAALSARLKAIALTAEAIAASARRVGTVYDGAWLEHARAQHKVLGEMLAVAEKGGAE